MLVLVVGLKCGTPKTQYVPNVKNIVILKNPRINRGFFIYKIVMRMRTYCLAGFTLLEFLADVVWQNVLHCQTIFRMES
jgi:hypothetical protein